MIYFASDTHFGHRKIMEYCNRPFESIEEHDEALIANWNGVVPARGATVYHLGDFAFFKDPDQTKRVLARLNGQIHFLFGNHDHKRFRKDLQNEFASTAYYKEVKVKDEDAERGKQMIVLCHYPFEIWNKSHYGSWHLHGHCHGTLPTGDHMRRVDAGVDVWNYAPVSYEQVKAHMATKVFKPIDHHRGKAPMDDDEPQFQHVRVDGQS